MKKHLLILLGVAFLAVVAVMVYSAPAQPPDYMAFQEKEKVMQADLREALERLKPGEFLRIIVRLRNQFPAEARQKILAGAENRKDLKQRRKELTRALRNHAMRTQRPILERLKRFEEEKLVRAVRPLWLSNVIGMEARREAIEQILKIDGLKYVKQDIKRPAFQQTPAWSVSHINADDVWTTPGITGNGVIVAIIDTGIDLDHPDLVNRMWINGGEDFNSDGQFTAADNNGVDDDGNGYVDDVVGWDLGNNDNSPDDWHGHGTHVSGSVAGDGAGGTATGVAPGAQLMVLGYSASITAGQTEAWEGMQYALDNGADIVNFSSGWKDSWSPDYQTWRDNTDVLTDAGVLFVVAAGNDNPHVAAPGDVLTPARAPRALAVGATDNTDTIASFSSTGPTSWEGVTGYDDYIHPPGLLKPDVSAPGVSVNSTNNGGGYVNGPVWSGTSMAAPHAAGLAALLLEEDPLLLPHELMYIIRETAVDLGAAGEDNVYGYGRIDALAAVNHTYTHTPVYDLSVTGTNFVWTTVDIWVDNNDDGTPDDPVANTDNHLYARIRNIGGQAVGNVEIKFYYADVGTIGISGFDPNNDGDPDDGNFNYIDSYFVPVVGPSGSGQDTAVGVVDWNVPVPVTDHWCVGIGIVAPNPPNATEAVRINNRAFRNFFDIVVVYSQVYTLKFFVYPDAKAQREAFDLEFIRKGLPPQFEVELAVEKRLAERWFRNIDGFERVKRPELKNMPLDEELALQRGEVVVEYVRLSKEGGTLRGIASPDGRPVPVTLMLRAPGRREAELMKPAAGEQLLVINAVRDREPFGGLALNVRLDTAGKEPQKGQLYRIKIEDAEEAALIEQQIGLKPERIQNREFFYFGDMRINKRLKEYGYVPELVDAEEVFSRFVLVMGREDEKPLQEAGVRIMLREPDHWIVSATTKQLRLLSRLGYRYEELRDREPRPRLIRVIVQSRNELRKIAPYLSDYFNTEPHQRRFAIYGSAWDDKIDELRSKGYTIERIQNGGR